MAFIQRKIPIFHRGLVVYVKYSSLFGLASSEDRAKMRLVMPMGYPYLHTLVTVACVHIPMLLDPQRAVSFPVLACATFTLPINVKMIDDALENQVSLLYRLMMENLPLRQVEHGLWGFEKLSRGRHPSQ